MDIPTQDELVTTIEAFLDRHDMAPTRLGADATGDPNLVKNLREGRSPRLSLLHKLKAFMAAKDTEAVAVDHVDNDTTSGAATSPGKSTDVTAEVAA